MTFAPDGQSLTCEYCSRNQKFTAQPGSANEKDFIIAMATARGHGKPLDAAGLSLRRLWLRIYFAAQPDFIHMCVLRFAACGQLGI